MTLPEPNDRVLLRDRPWLVRHVQPLGDHRGVIELEALDADEPRHLTALVPPDAAEPLPPAAIQFDLTALDSFAAWSRAHRILGATLVRETGLLSGARFGRVALEAYQLAPTLRLLSKPRPSFLVADDVGLGKTIEAGLALLELMARGRANRVLIVAPPGLLNQWQEELQEKFGLEFTVIENAAALARVQTDLPAGINPWDALPRVLTSLDYVKKETVRNRALRKRWDLVIVDEAHALAESGTPQNPYRTQRTRLGVALRDASRGLLLLTATPHNGYAHSYRSLLELVEPTLATFLGSDEDVVRRIETARIRRMKVQIHRKRPDGSEEPVFPKRNVRGIPVTGLNPGERELLLKVSTYCSQTARAARGDEEEDLITFAMQIVKKRALSSRRALHETLKNRLEALGNEDAREAPPDRYEIRDLQASLPLGEAVAERIVWKVLRSAIPKEERRRKNEVKALKAIQRLLRSLPDADPKIEALVREIEAVRATDPSDKVIVFTEYLDTLGAIHERLAAIPELADRIEVLKGGLSPRQRRQRQEAFERKASVLLATDAASEGLNLQRACRRVIHMELPWNPNRLEQRNGRVDRYGQARTPEIRYLYYPDSPEDDVLNLLVDKIERMAESRVSTADILGVLAGDDDVVRSLVELDAASGDVEAHKQALVRLFDDRTAEFVRSVQPLVAAGGAGEEMSRILGLLDTAEPLLLDDEGLEQVVTRALKPGAVRAGPLEGAFRIEVPLALRGASVKPVYSAATFRRSVAVRYRAEDVEYVTPLHPLVQALASDARRRLLHVYPSARGLPPRRLAARIVGPREPASVLYTFLTSVQGGSGLLEECLVAVRVDVQGSLLGDPQSNMRWLQEEGEAGEVRPERVQELFGPRFDAAAVRATEEATRIVEDRVRSLRDRRKQQAEILRRDLEVDLAARLREITEEERRARGLLEETGQQRLFEKQDSRRLGFDTRREAAQSQAETRRAEIAEFEQVDEPAAPRPLGALFLVPPETR